MHVYVHGRSAITPIRYRLPQAVSVCMQCVQLVCFSRPRTLPLPTNLSNTGFRAFCASGLSCCGPEAAKAGAAWDTSACKGLLASNRAARAFCCKNVRRDTSIAEKQKQMH